MSTASGAWKLGLVPQAVANGLSGILVVLFVLSGLGGGLLDVGLVAAVTALALVPSQYFWGKLIDGAGRCKPFLSLGFAGMGATLAAVPESGGVPALLALVAAKSVSYGATVPARQLLTVETERREGWRRGLANMQFLTSMGETAGMGAGALLVGPLGYSNLFLLCGGLCAASAAMLWLLAAEPGFMIQRRLAAMERSTAALVAVSELVASPRRTADDFERVSREVGRSTAFLLAGIFAFSLAGTTLFSPLPAYFVKYYDSSQVFGAFFWGSLVGALFYLVVGRGRSSPGPWLIGASSLRVLAIPALGLAAAGGFGGLAAGIAVLAVLEALWSVFDVVSVFAFLETARVGRAGVYGALTGLGSACGGVLGGLVSMSLGFGALFAVSAGICGAAFLTFAMQYWR